MGALTYPLRALVGHDQDRAAIEPRVTPEATFAALFACVVVAALAVPILPDEAYYVAWSQRPALGYLDHPPVVALLASASRLLAGSASVARIGSLLTTLLAFAATVHLGRSAGLDDRRVLATATLLRFGTPIGLGVSFLVTPDGPMFAAWALALAEACRALRGDRRRWLSAGVAVGLGLWCKYTTALLGPVFLWGMIRSDRAALRTRWPYLGGVLALAVLGPHLAWNARHDWQTLAFQLGHGFAGTHEVSAAPICELPVAERPRDGGPEAALTEVFRATNRVSARIGPKPFTTSGAAARLATFAAGQVGLWGMLALPLLALVGSRWASRHGRSEEPALPGPGPGSLVDPRVKPLLAASVVVPLAFFGLMSIRGGGELNWPAMYVIGASTLWAPLATGWLRWLIACLALQFAVGIALLVHLAHPFLPIPLAADRLTEQTHGFEALAHELTTLDGPVFGSSYQLVALARFYEPDLAIRQWPGVTRPSELSLRDGEDRSAWARVLRSGHFWLLSSHAAIPHVPRATARDLVEIRDYSGEDGETRLEQRHARGRTAEPAEAGARPIHAWYLVDYVVSAASAVPEQEEASGDASLGELDASDGPPATSSTVSRSKNLSTVGTLSTGTAAESVSSSR